MKKKILIMGIIAILVIIVIVAFVAYKYLNSNSKEQISDDTSEQIEVSEVKKQDGKYGIVNSKGDVIVPFEYDDGYDYNNGVAVLTNENGSTYFDNNGKVIGIRNCAIEGETGTYTESDYLAMLDKSTGLYGYIDNQGYPKTEFKWLRASNFCNNLALVTDKTGTYVIDMQENVVISSDVLSKYLSLNPVFKNKLIIVSTKGQAYGVLDINGKEIIPCDIENKYIEITDEAIEVHRENDVVYYNLKGDKI